MDSISSELLATMLPNSFEEPTSPPKKSRSNVADTQSNAFSAYISDQKIMWEWIVGCEPLQ